MSRARARARGRVGRRRARSRSSGARTQAGGGQAAVEFALISLVLLTLVFAVVDLSRAGFMQHDLDSGAGDLARALAALSGTNSSGNANLAYSATPLTAANTQAALAHAAQVANDNFSAAPPLTTTGAMTLTNGQVTVVATPNLTTTTELTVTVVAPFTPTVGFILNGAILHLQATTSALTPAGVLGQ